MNNSIRGVLIDPENKTITEVDVPADSNGSYLTGICSHLQCEWVEVGRSCLEYLPSSPADDLWFDEDGNFGDGMFAFKTPRLVPLIGRGLILSYDDEGRCVSHTLTTEDIEQLNASIEWLTRDVMR